MSVRLKWDLKIAPSAEAVRFPSPPVPEASFSPHSHLNLRRPPALPSCGPQTTPPKPDSHLERSAGAHVTSLPENATKPVCYRARMLFWMNEQAWAGKLLLMRLFTLESFCTQDKWAKCYISSPIIKFYWARKKCFKFFFFNPLDSFPFFLFYIWFHLFPNSKLFILYCLWMLSCFMSDSLWPHGL